jgi:beta-phosphoglucomutase-like phosphatase (HAD superfamily)
LRDQTSGERALIFDMDGVLIDSEPLWRRAEIEALGEVGLVLEDADCFQTQGLRIDEAVAFWYQRAPWIGRSCEDVASSIVSRMALMIRSEGEPIPGALSSIDWAANSNWRLALASSSPNFLIETVLDRFEIAHHFECARSAEDEKYGKPQPDVYLSAARDLRLEPGVCVAVEDSANGVDSAISAGMRCIAVPPAETRSDARFEAATLKLGSLQDLPAALEQLEEL